MKKLLGSYLIIMVFILGISSNIYAAELGATRAKQIKTDVTNFDGSLSSADTDLQKVADTLDDAIAGAGSGDVTSVGDCLTGACNDGTSDGGTYIKFYDAQGAGTLGIADLSAAHTWTLPNHDATIDNLTTSTTTNLTGFIKGNGSVLSADNSTYLTAEVDGSTTNEIEVVDEAFNATNFNGGTTSAVSQDDFYDLWHGIDTDDDGDIDAMDATVWATKQAADADLTDLADGSLTASKVAGVADADYGEVVVSSGAWALENDALDDQYYDSEADLTGLLDNNYQPLEATLTDIADGTIAEDLVNTANPWADNEVSDTLTASVVSDADKGDITISSGAWAVEDDSHAHTATTISGLGTDDISGLSLFNDIASFPADPGSDQYLMWDDDPGAFVFSTPAGSGDITAVGDCADSACFTGTTGTNLVFNDAGGDGTLDYDGTSFTIDKPFVVTGLVTTSIGIDGVGAVDLDYGSVDVTDHTFITDSTGDAEIVLPNDSIGDAEIAFDEVTGADLTLTDCGAVTSSGTITSSGTFDATGAVGLVLGSADITSFTVTTDGTGNAEFTLPNDVIGDADIDWGTGAGQVSGADITFAEGDMTDSTIVSADIKNAEIVSADLSGTAGITLAQTAMTAGRSLTIATNDVAADAELYTDTKCIYWENPVATDDFKSIWYTPIAATITGIWAESDQTVTFMLQVDDGSPADVDSVDLAPAAGVASDTSLDGDATLAAGDRLDMAVTSVANTPTWCSVCFTYTNDD